MSVKVGSSLAPWRELRDWVESEIGMAEKIVRKITAVRDHLVGPMQKIAPEDEPSKDLGGEIGEVISRLKYLRNLNSKTEEELILISDVLGMPKETVPPIGDIKLGGGKQCHNRLT